MTSAAHTIPRRELPYGNQRLSARGMAVVVLVHVALVALLISLDVVPSPAAVVTLMVQVIPAAAPAAPEPPPVPEPKPVAPKPLPKPRRAPTPPPPAPVLAAATETSAPVAEVPIATPVPEVIEPAPPEPAVTQPRFDADYLSNPAPVYPSMSRRLREEGTVTLRVFVNPDGRPGTIEIETSSGFSRLDDAAREAVARWKFVPARRGEEHVGAWVLVPVIFNVRG
ncbi:MAG: energy transducer TonB [Gammaproteobacteria bacterium]|nr:energy transducer TonB [Gammaproteobacteria bacterium]